MKNKKENKNKLKTVFLGNNSPQFKVLCELTDVKAIFTRDIETDLNIQKIKKIAAESNIPVYTPKTMKLEKDKTAYETIKKINPDLIVSAGFHLIVPKEIIELPKYKTINIHPALLPKYRGQHVIQWQIINNEKETGVTIHYMNENLDEGDIIKQGKCSIEKDETALDVWNKTSRIGAILLKEVIPEFENGAVVAYKQNSSKATYFNKRTPEDGKIDWHKKPFQIYNLIRALVQPWPGAFFVYKGKQYVVEKITYKETPVNDEKISKIHTRNKDEFSVYCSSGLIYINKKDIRNIKTDLEEFVPGTKMD